MIRDGKTGDWIGTFLGHKGAVWQAKLSPDVSNAATASADFTAKIWDTYTGQCRYTLSHGHIVRAVAYPPDNSDLLATGGFEKKLRLFDLSATAAPTGDDLPPDGVTISCDSAFEIGPGVHTASIKFIVWSRDPNTLITAAGKTLRWFDLPSRSVVKEEVLDGEIGSCEFSTLAPELVDPTDIGEGLPVLCVAAGKTVYFWGGDQAKNELKRVSLPYKVASVAVDVKEKKFIVGEDIPATWARVYRWEDGSEFGKSPARPLATDR
jgi:serine-threonine kinase receptor-associated protein